MIFISYAELAKDIAAWSEILPRNLDLIVGVPRSGMIPATLLALHRNIKLTSVEDLRDGRIFNGGIRDQLREVKTAFVLDDSLLSGKSLLAAGDSLRHIKSFKILYGAVYIKPEARSPAWNHFKCVPLPRIFEWNWLHHYWLAKTCMDIDGVLCRDPTNEENDDGLRYRKFLHTVSPRHIPTVSIHTLVTSRLECYRGDTEKWLARHGVLYKHLVMHPAKTAKERRAMNDHAAQKARTFNNQEYMLFVESSEKQAIEIHRLTKKPVLCTDTMTLHS